MTTNSTITPEVLDQLLANYEKPEDLIGDDGLFRQLKKALIEQALGAELTEHLGYEKGDPAGRGCGNSRNGSSSKTVLTEDGEIEIAVPRDRAGSFEPQLIAKGQTRFDGFDDKILSLYARGMTVREIQGHLLELYGTEVSRDHISRVTDAVLHKVRKANSIFTEISYTNCLTFPRGLGLVTLWCTPQPNSDRCPSFLTQPDPTSQSNLARPMRELCKN